MRVGGTVAVALLVALAVLATPGLAAAPTVDTESTATTTTSNVTDGTVIAGFEANSSNSSYLEANFDSANASVEIIDPDTGVVHATNDSDGMEVTNSSENYYAWDIGHDELATIPHGANENKSVTIKLINNTDVDNPDTTEITVYLETVDDRAVVYGGAEAAAGNVGDVDVTTEVDEPPLGLSILGSNSSTTSVSADSVSLGNTSEGTTVHVIAANTSGEDPFSAASEDGFLMGTSDGDFIDAHQLQVAGHNHAVFLSEAPDGVVDGYTYGVTETVNGEDAYAVHIGDDYSGESSVDISTTANDDYGPWTSLQVQRDALGGWGAALSPGTIGGGLTAGA